MTIQSFSLDVLPFINNSSSSPSSSSNSGGNNSKEATNRQRNKMIDTKGKDNMFRMSSFESSSLISSAVDKTSALAQTIEEKPEEERRGVNESLVALHHQHQNSSTKSSSISNGESSTSDSIKSPESGSNFSNDGTLGLYHHESTERKAFKKVGKI